MKRILFCLIAFWGVYCGLSAQEYHLAEIQDIAFSFLNRHLANTYSRSNTAFTKQLSNIETIGRDSTCYMYVINTEDAAGWVMLSNEKRYPTIIAHADSGSFFYDRDILPPALLCILEQHMDAIDSTRANTYSEVQSRSNSISSGFENIEEYTSPVLLAQNRWTQSGNQAYGEFGCDLVYNKFIPASQNISCGRALVGCGAVAMAQIMSYWQWPDYAYIKDTIIGGVCHGDFNQHFYDWDDMPNQIDFTTSIYQANTIAGLLRDCAYAANTVFHGPNAFCENGCSSAIIGNINGALKNVFCFNTNRKHEYPTTDMEPILRQEINAKRPVLCQAWENSDTTKLSAHTFVIDGYKTHYEGERLVTLFTINWGWGENRSDIMYYSMDFNGYDGNRTFLTEIYPLCNLLDNDVSLSSNITINTDDNRTYYSSNSVTICSNNNSITVNSGGHLFVKAGNKIHVKNGFHAQPGSKVCLKIDSLCSTETTSTSMPQRIVSKTPSKNDTNSIDNTITNNSLENIEYNEMVSISIYTISGQLIQTIIGGQVNISHLPNGIYILRHCMSDGSVRCEKITKI